VHPTRPWAQPNQKSVYKDKSKRHRTFNAEINDSDDDDFSSEFEKKEKISDKIVVLFKKTVNKMFKSE